MAHVATVNGKKIHSDKRMAGIVNTRVTFTDGSWCDASTGKMHNVGSGYITIDGMDTEGSTEKTTDGPKRVAASAFEVRGITADVQVDTHHGSDIEYTVTGPAGDVKAIRASVESHTLVIEGDGSASSGGGTDIRVSGANVVISGRGSFLSNISARGSVTITGSGGRKESSVRVLVKVPIGTPVTVRSVFGDVVVGDTKGPLAASVQADSVRAGSVTDAQLTVQGSGDISVEEVTGSVIAQVQGSGDIEIDGGAMSSLTASVQGSGGIKVGGSAATANLTVMGSGDIRVSHVEQRPIESIMGSGDIRVKRVG